MFHVEPLQSLIVDKLTNQGVYDEVKICPLDDVVALAGLPENWDLKPTCMPKCFADRAEEFANFKVRNDDVWIVTYPKCGTTWTQEMAWVLSNDMNFDKANSLDITKRCLFFELNGMIEAVPRESFQALEEQTSPRVIKTHLPISLLPRDIWKKNCKIIYVARDPKDVVVSFFHHFSGMTSYTGGMEDFFEAFLADEFIYCSYWQHVLEFWLIRQRKNILFITFENMKKDLKSIVDRTSVFLGKKFESEELAQLVDHLSFEKMKLNPTCNNQGLVKYLYGNLNKEYSEETAFKFMRKGIVGSYKKDLSIDFCNKINLKTKEMFEPHGLNLYWS